MRSRLSLRSVAFVPLALALLVPAAGPSLAKEKREPIEKFRANAFSWQLGRASLLDIDVYEWTAPEERQALLATFVEKGNEALYDALGDVSVKARVRLPRTLGYDMMYAWQTEVDGKRRIVLATDRPLGFLEVMGGFRSRDYNVSLIILELDPETNEGEGTAVGGAELSINKKTNQFEIEFLGTKPSRLTKVKPLKVKKKR